MTDIKQIADDCASRIMDRMEMCRGSAILKGDIAREVELALMEAAGEQEWVDEEAVVPASLIDRALKALGEQAFSEPNLAVIDEAAWAEINKSLQRPEWRFAHARNEVQWSLPQDPKRW